MKTLIVIPVRMGSSRFPGKPLANINGTPMLEHVVENARQSSRASEVAVATCDSEIAEYCRQLGVNFVMTSAQHTRATERTHEAVSILEAQGSDYELVIMLQGDEPCITGRMIDLQIQECELHPDWQVTNLLGRITSREEHEDPNTIKVVTGLDRNCLYLSREPIPGRGHFSSKSVSKQVCSISFRRHALQSFVETSNSNLEEAESIDMLRLIESGRAVFGIETSARTQAVDVRADVAKVERLISGLDEPGL